MTFNKLNQNPEKRIREICLWHEYLGTTILSELFKGKQLGRTIVPTANIKKK
jgi:hypothetical protein